MAETLIHAFQSVKPDSPDPSLVSSAEWNDGHVFQGGVNGQVLVFDNTQPKNMRWTDGVHTYGSNQTIPSSTPTPIVNFAPFTFTSNSNVNMFLSSRIELWSSVGNATITIRLIADTIERSSIAIASPQLAVPINVIANFPLTPGSHTIFARIETVGNVNVLLGTVFLVGNSQGY